MLAERASLACSGAAGKAAFDGCFRFGGLLVEAPQPNVPAMSEMAV